MKVLLRRNVPKLGIIGDVVDVKPGYARNYLLPQQLATQPTEENLQAIEAEKEAYLAELAKRKAELETVAQGVDGKEITIPARANEEGHLYGSVGPAQIAAALAEQGTMVETDWIQLPDPIRQLDKYDIPLDFGHEVTATVSVWVVPIREAGAEGEGLGPAPTPSDEALESPEPIETDETEL